MWCNKGGKNKNVLDSKLIARKLKCSHYLQVHKSDDSKTRLSVTKKISNSKMSSKIKTYLVAFLPESVNYSVLRVCF